MCRFAIYVSPLKPVYLADLLTRPTHSIVKQSYGCTERNISYAVPSSINADGFGVAWYSLDYHDNNRNTNNNNNNNNDNESKHNSDNDDDDDDDDDGSACLFRSMLPAWNDKNLHRLAKKIKSSLIFAHVRAASLGSIISNSNCHPFIYKKFTFMHNGGIGKFSKIKRNIVLGLKHDLFANIKGTTDSEHAFMMFLNNLIDVSGDNNICSSNSNMPPQMLLKAMKITIAQIVYLQMKNKLQCKSTLNFAVTDGNTTLVSRVITSTIDDVVDKNGNGSGVDNSHNDGGGESKPASLYFSCGSSWSKCSDKEYRMRHLNLNEDVVIIASERLTRIKEDWVEVSKNCIVLVSKNANILMFNIDVKSEVDLFEKNHSFKRKGKGNGNKKNKNGNAQKTKINQTDVNDDHLYDELYAHV